jgi:3-methyladenine DNA glycosylase/8-oxoguanine DNA glycosylase
MGTRPTCAYSLYELLVILICLQNAPVRRTESMMQHLFEAYGERVTFDGRSLWAFWDPKDLVGQEDRLRELRLGYRARSLERLSRYFSDVAPGFEARLWTLSDESLVTALREIPSVGPATAGGLMFDYFHRYDSLEYLSPWETKIFRRLLREPKASSAGLVSQAHRSWPGYSMLALHLLFEDQFWRMRDGLPHVLAGVSTPSPAAGGQPGVRPREAGDRDLPV